MRASIRATQRHLKPYRTIFWTTAHLPQNALIADDEGQFAFEGLYEEVYTFEISDDGFEKATVELIEPGAKDVKVVLKK